MRVTANTFPNSLVEQLNRLGKAQNQFQTQAATGQKVRLPEDDPAAMRRVLDMESEGRSIQQYRRNTTALRENAQTIYQALREFKRISDRARELATYADDTKSPDELRTYAIEISQLIKRAVQLANTKHRGDHLFGGTLTSNPPFSATETPGGQISAVNYSGNEDTASAEISQGLTLSVGIIGANESGSGSRGLLKDARHGVDFIGHLIALEQHLRSGDTQAIAIVDQNNLGQDEENFLLHISENGVLQARLEATDASSAQQAQSLDVLISREADADVAQVLMKLNQTQTAYQLAMQTGARLLNSSLLDYLR